MLTPKENEAIETFYSSLESQENGDHASQVDKILVDCRDDPEKTRAVSEKIRISLERLFRGTDFNL